MFFFSGAKGQMKKIFIQNVRFWLFENGLASAEHSQDAFSKQLHFLKVQEK